MEPQVEGPDMAAVARVLRAMSPEALKIMRQHLRTVAKPILADERAAVQSLKMSTAVTTRSGVLRRKTTTVTEGTGESRGSGARQREAAILARRKGGVVGFAKARKAAAKRSGLRASIARGMRITYSDSKSSAGVVVRTSGTSLPADQRGLAKAMNRGKWRHPVFNTRNEPRSQWSWVEQRVSKPQWWDETARANYPQVNAEMDAALKEWAVLAAHLTQRAAG